MSLFDKLHKMDISTFNQFIEKHLNDDNYKIIESRSIQIEHLPYLCAKPYLADEPFDFLLGTVSSICYKIVFSYHIIKKTLFNYESADISIKDDLYFFDKADADLYLKYAKCPSEPLNNYLNDYIKYLGIPINLTNISILTFKHIELNDFIAIKMKNGSTYLFTRADSDYITKYTPSLNILFNQYDLFKDNVNNEKPIEKTYIDPKIEFIVRNEIERTEKYLKTLKQII